MLYEMLTGEFLFDPKKEENIKKSEDHLALMMEMLNKFPRNYSTIGTNSKKYFNEQGNLKKIESLNFMGLKDTLIKVHRVRADEAEALANFLMPMLKIYPEERATAKEMLNHPWLDMESDEFFASKEYMFNHSDDYDTSKINTDMFQVVVDEEDFFGDVSYISSEVEEENEDEKYVEVEFPDYYNKETKFFDRSFKNVYVGYADGIDLNQLDNTANWQFNA